MPAYIKTSSNWRSISQIWIKVSSTWRSVSQGWINIAGTYRQFFGIGNEYAFSFGNTVHVGTNGYISLDSGQSAISISSTTGRVLGILPADLELNSIRYAADSSKFYVFYRGKRLGQTNFEIEYEVHFTDGQDYALIKLVAFPSSTYSLTGYYFNGSSTGNSRITATRTVGAEYRVYFGTTAAFATSFTEYGTSSHPVWLAQSTLTSGNSDDGYISVVANQGSSPQAPTSVTASSITGSGATISWTGITSNINAGMSAIQSYDYSINGGGSWTSTGLTTSATITGLSSSTSYTVLVRANNYFFTGTNYGSVNFNTLAGAPTITSLTASAPNTSSQQSVLVTVSWASTNQASYFLSVFQAGIASYQDTGTTQTSSSQSDAGSNFNVFSGASVSISLTVYSGPNQTGDSATSNITYTPPIIPTVSNVTASSITATSATISWSSTGQDSYNITGLPSSYSGTSATSRAVSGLTASTSYTATVTVTSLSGNTASSSVSFTTSAAPVASVTDIYGQTGGRIANNNWANPKMTMYYYFSNVTSATARIQRSPDNSTWTSGITESLTVSSNSATQTTNQPVGTTNASGNFWYRAQVISLNGVELPTPITSASTQNTATAKFVILYP